jgi:hypothetical protein
MTKRPKVIECGACGHPHYHCPASGCNADECECMKFQQLTELELTVLEKIAAGRRWGSNISNQAIYRLQKKGCLDPGSTNVTESGRAVVLGTPAEDLRDILGLVTEQPPTVASLASLTRDQREELREWAGREHLHASDNPRVRRLPRPALLDTLPVET